VKLNITRYNLLTVFDDVVLPKFVAFFDYEIYEPVVPAYVSLKLPYRNLVDPKKVYYNKYTVRFGIYKWGLNVTITARPHLIEPKIVQKELISGQGSKDYLQYVKTYL